MSADRQERPVSAARAVADPDRVAVHERQLAYVRESVLLGIRYAGERRAPTPHAAGG
jgi:hypothetical protein